MISAIHLEQSLYWIWNWYWSVPSEKKKWDLGIFTLPPCIQVLLHAEWSSHTMTMEESGWSGYRWEDQSRFSCVCRYQSFLEIPEKIQKKNNTTWVTVNLHRPSKVSKDQSRLLNIVYIVKLHIWIVQFTKIGRAFLNPNILNIYWKYFVTECHCCFLCKCSLSGTFIQFNYFYRIFPKLVILLILTKFFFPSNHAND